MFTECDIISVTQSQLVNAQCFSIRTSLSESSLSNSTYFFLIVYPLWLSPKIQLVGRQLRKDIFLVRCIDTSQRHPAAGGFYVTPGRSARHHDSALSSLASLPVRFKTTIKPERYLLSLLHDPVKLRVLRI